MKPHSFPLAPWEPGIAETFDLETSDDIVGVARQLIDGTHPGVLATVDAEGRPHLRWMATMAFDEFPLLYTLTAPDSRKVSHLATCPWVTWMFSNRDLTFILTLRGQARLLKDSRSIKRIWKMIEDKSHAYFLENFTERPGFAVIQTDVDEIECSIPQSALRWRMDVATLRPEKFHNTSHRKLSAP